MIEDKAIIEKSTDSPSCDEISTYSVDDSGKSSCTFGFDLEREALDLYDPTVEKIFYPQQDPLMVGFIRYQKNKERLLHLLKNPLC